MELNEKQKQKQGTDIDAKGDGQGKEKGIARLGDLKKPAEAGDDRVTKVFDPFQRRDSISRTPPKKEKGPAVEAVEELERWQDEELQTSPIFHLQGESEREPDATGEISPPCQGASDTHLLKKRKWSTLSPQDRTTNIITEVNWAMNKVIKRTKELEKLVNTAPKTKIEIKQATRELVHLVARLEKRIKTCEEMDITPSERKETKGMGTQTDLRVDTVAVQTEWDDIELERRKEEEKLRTEVREVLGMKEQLPGLARLLDKSWPEDIYTKTKTVSWSSVKMNSEGDIAIMLDPERVPDDKCLKDLQLKYPDLEEIIKKNDKQVDYLLETVTTRTKTRETTGKTKALYVLPMVINSEGINPIEDSFNKIRELKEVMDVHPTKKIILYASEGLNQEYIRKMCECIFAEHDIVIGLVSLDSKPKSKPEPKPETQKLIVRSGKTSYADLLRSVKDNVDIGKVGVKVKAIKKTTKGDLLLEVEGGRKKAGDLREAIKEKLDSDVRVTGNNVTLHILDIDATTTKEEVAMAIRKQTGRSELQDNMVTSMRPCKDGNQIATVQVSPGIANKLLKAGRMKIGWVGCRVRKRVTLIRCYRCLDFGHTREGCNGPDRSDLCVNCCQPGHQVKDCTNKPFCRKCQTQDHRSDTTKCPAFRALLKPQQGDKRPIRDDVKQTK